MIIVVVTKISINQINSKVIMTWILKIIIQIYRIKIIVNNLILIIIIVIIKVVKGKAKGQVDPVVKLIVINL